MKKKNLALILIVLLATVFALAACSAKVTKVKLTSAKTDYYVGEEITVSTNITKAPDGTVSWFFVENTCQAKSVKESYSSISIVATKNGYFKIACIVDYKTETSRKTDYNDDKNPVGASNVLTINVIANDDAVEAEEIINVSAVNQFLAQGANATYVLQNDIDFSGVDYTLFPEFRGVLDGNGFSLKNISIESLRLENFGVISVNKGVIKNLIIENLELSSYGDSQNAGFVGNNQGVVENVRVSGEIFTELYANVGGIAGVNHGTIKACTNLAKIFGGSNVGGICGENNGSVADCVNREGIVAKRCAGGIVGNNLSTQKLSDCLNTAAVRATGDGTSYKGDYAGGIAGMSLSFDGGGTIINCYNYGTVSGNSYLDGICPVSSNTKIDCVDFGETVITDESSDNGGKGTSTTEDNASESLFIDLRMSSVSTLQISSYTRSVEIIGNGDTIVDFSINILNRDIDLTLTLNNLSTMPVGRTAIEANTGTNAWINIIAKGESVIRGGIYYPAIKGGNIKIVGDGDLQIIGGGVFRGAGGAMLNEEQIRTAANARTDTSTVSGASGIECNSLVIQGTGAIKILGGDGADGLTNAKRHAGSGGIGIRAEASVTIIGGGTTVEVSGGKGGIGYYRGGPDGNSGFGGTGGVGIFCNGNVTLRYVTVSGGNGGDAGNGTYEYKMYSGSGGTALKAKAMVGDNIGVTLIAGTRGGNASGGYLGSDGSDFEQIN